MDDLLSMSGSQLIAAFRRRALSPVEVMAVVLDHATQFNRQVNCLCCIDEEGALATARESEQRWMRNEPCGLLDGVPVSVKDLVAVRGMPTRYGSLVSSAGAEQEDAPAVRRLRHAGALLFGKATTSEYGNKIVTDSPLTGITRNPWNTHVTSGGSSGGSAVAVAFGMGPLSLATDGGGSIRVPACWSGVVGFKPSFGMVPTGTEGSWTSLSTLGPIARNVSDAALMLTVMARAQHMQDPLMSCCRDWRIGLDAGVAGLRVAYCAAPAGVRVEPAIADCVGQGVAVIETLGAHVEEAEIAPLGGYLKSRMHSIQWSVFFAQRIRQLDEHAQAQLDPDVRTLAESGARETTFSLVDALQARHALTVAMTEFFEHYDLLVTPTFHCGPPPVPGLPEELRGAPPLTSWCNQTGFPAVSVPCGLPAGMPTGLQIIGPRGADARVLRVARAYESARGPFPMPGRARDRQIAEVEAQP
ncbi:MULTISPECIES: amidase family protein [Burkholderia]|uniref:Aspartyl-tRNA(Asn)/glutamyl-tRNA(Gln) amidotransferase subunit A n=1 Tax=Burkholderia pyrrocinia TaxID=60550 RepID=A0A318HXA2_BURPY|nr:MULTISPECIES: amidase family protein [Burkholderia]PXX23094.1 aspartyl-tRNA(Asn)/glutamyl-tRNA(Gln) amidotransferase subunit A [Burkholderia pyrrocinia]SFW88753.1 aspartyl-tRNA(Asn)/glutamyl-tRNA(Gln) amidotransferase subunit A [Burkholderia sp. NFACC33-1]SFY46174.1 aspartyl-tRNA(Asn)/glutamyl-tRNA(Gln) amidotransferase subunit A [Burkholderia sp. NFPP32]